MSVSDFLLTFLNCICNYIYMRDQVWYFNEVACALNNFLAVLTISASVLNLTAMSVTRYYAVVFPLKSKLRSRHVTLTILLAWLFSFILALPNMFYSKVLAIPALGGNICILDWSNRYWEEAYNILLTVFTYALPLLVITLTTIHMTHVLWGRPPPGEINAQLELSIKKKKKIVKLLWILLLVFGVCWLPYHLYFIIIVYFPHIGKWAHVQNLFLSFYLLAMSHAVVNPVVYFTFNKTLRQTLVQRLSVLSFWNQRTQESPAQNQDDHASDSESQQVLSILELIPLKYSPKHNGNVFSYIETTNILSDEEKPQKDQTGEQLEKAETEKERDILNTNGSFKRLKKRILISLNEAFNRILTKKKNSFQDSNNTISKETKKKVYYQDENKISRRIPLPKYTTV